MVVSPTARATFIRWVTEWYETHVVFRYAGDDVQGKMPQYEIGELPDGFSENLQKGFCTAGMSVHYYADKDGEAIVLRYIYMQQGSMTGVDTENSDIISVSVNGCDGYLIIPREAGCNNTITWSAAESNLHFTIDAPLGETDILHMAESVSLVETTKKKCFLKKENYVNICSFYSCLENRSDQITGGNILARCSRPLVPISTARHYTSILPSCRLASIRCSRH